MTENSLVLNEGIIKLRVMKESQFTGLVVFNLANFFLYNLANSFLASMLGKTLFGHFMLSLSLLGALAPILLVGNYYLVTQEVPLNITKRDKKKLKEFLRWSLTFLLKCVVGSVILVCILLFLQHEGYLTCHHRSCNDNSVFYADALYIAPLYIIMFWNAGYLLTLNEASLGTALSANVGKGVLIYLFSAIIAAATAIVGSLDYVQTLLAFLLSQVLLLGCQYAVIQMKRHKALSISLTDTLSARKLPKSQQSNLLERSVFFVPCDVLYALVGISIVTTIEFSHPLKNTLSDYYICGIIGSIISVFTNAMQTNMWCLYSTAGTARNQKATTELETLFKKTVIYGGFWLILSAAVITTFYPYIKDLYEIKNPYMLAGIGLQMTLNYLSQIWMQPENILTYHGKTGAVYLGNIVQAIMQVILCYHLVQTMGFIGALIASILGSLTCAIICFFALKKSKIAIKPFGYC